MNNKDTLKKKIIELSGEFSQNNHQQNLPGYDSKKPIFIPGINSVPYAARTFDQTEVKAAINSLLDFELTLGKEGELFENELSSYLSTKKTLLVNSGSSANLLALSSLTSHTIKKDRRIMQGDEIITCAAGFPTTVSPIIQNKCVPVFLDNNPASPIIIPSLAAASRSRLIPNLRFISATMGCCGLILCLLSWNVANVQL